MKNSDYWKKRFEELEDRRTKEAAAYYRDVGKQFRLAQNDMEKGIERWYQRLADNNEISYAAAQQLLKKGELTEFKWSVEEYIKKGQENAVNQRWIKELENASARVHISNLEAMKIAMQQQSEILFAQLKQGLTGHLSKAVEDTFYKNAFEIAKGTGVGSVVPYLDTQKIEQVLNKTWAADGSRFSDRIWSNKQKLIGKLHTELAQSIIRGESPDKTIKRLAEEMGVSRKQAGRLIMTETAAISSAATLESYKELGIKQYQILATLDNRTSIICQEKDQKVFDLKDYQVGLTAPPFHPFCRTTTVPYFNDEFTRGEQRSAKDETGKTYYVPANITYKEWKQEYVKDMKQIGLLAGKIDKGEMPFHQAPSILEKIDISDKNLVRLKLEEYEKQIVKEPIEHAIVITKLGEIIQCFGNTNGVYPDIDLGKKLKGAIVTHNHPINSNNEYSFSTADLMLFQDYELEILRGIDENYIYELTRNSTEIDEYISLMDMDLDGKDFRHNKVIELARRQKIGYRRYRRGK